VDRRSPTFRLQHPLTPAPDRPALKAAIEVTTDSGVASAEQTVVAPTSACACAVHRDAIELGLSRGRNAMAIWQDLIYCGPQNTGVVK